MKKSTKLFWIGLLFLVIGFGSMGYCFYLDRDIVVSGTIYGMNQTAYGKSYTPHYQIAVHPDDKTKYKDFDVEVAYHEYANRKVGDKVAYYKCGQYVLRNPPKEEIWVGMVILGLLIGVTLLLIAFMQVVEYDN